METFIKEVGYQPRRPVSIERTNDDGVIIEGVFFPGDFFRMLAEAGAPRNLYSFASDGKRAVWKRIETLREAGLFFMPELMNAFEGDA